MFVKVYDNLDLSQAHLDDVLIAPANRAKALDLARECQLPSHSLTRATTQAGWIYVFQLGADLKLGTVTLAGTQLGAEHVVTLAVRQSDHTATPDAPSAGMDTELEFPSCSECEGPLKLQTDTRYAYCLNENCPCDGLPAGDVVIERGQTEPGWPRPVIEGRPVPWLAPIIGDRVAWTSLNAHRIREAERHWLCQVCGQSMDPTLTAWVAVLAGEVAAGGAMHSRCLALARKVCPVLREDDSLVSVEVRRDDQAHDWAAVVQRLETYEEQHGQLPEVIPLQQRP